MELSVRVEPVSTVLIADPLLVVDAPRLVERLAMARIGRGQQTLVGRALGGCGSKGERQRGRRGCWSGRGWCVLEDGRGDGAATRSENGQMLGVVDDEVVHLRMRQAGSRWGPDFAWGLEGRLALWV